MRIRFVQIDVLHSVVHGPDASRGFPLSSFEIGPEWEPFQVEFRGSLKGREYVRLAIWLKEREP